MNSDLCLERGVTGYFENICRKGILIVNGSEPAIHPMRDNFAWSEIAVGGQYGDTECHGFHEDNAESFMV